MELMWLAFVAGVLSFISPCTFPLYPSYVSYITGLTIKELSNQSEQSLKVKIGLLLHTLLFVLGLSTVFFILGSTFTLIGEIFVNYKELIRMIGAIFIVVMGLFLTGVIQPISIMKERRFRFANKPVGYLGSFLLGVVFSAGWTPCIGPIFSSILTLSATHPNQGLVYITAYTLGFSIPFIIMAFFLGRTRWILKYSNRLMKFGGLTMIIFGLLLYFDKIYLLSSWLNGLF